MILPRPGIRRPFVGGALVAFGFPVVAFLLELMLDRAVRDPVCPLSLAVCVRSAVMRLGEGPLRLFRRPSQGARQFLGTRLAAQPDSCAIYELRIRRTLRELEGDAVDRGLARA